VTDPVLEVLGAPGSPYTRKMIALLRYRHIPHEVTWGGHHQAPRPGYPAPRVKLLPTIYRRGEEGSREALVDTTPLIRRFERDYAGREAIPAHPLLAFLCDLIEDYGDEWLTRPMFHYRWAHAADRDNIEPLLILWNDPTCDDKTLEELATAFGERQHGRLHVVGSNKTTAATIENSYLRLVDILDRLLARRGFVLGGRPSAADFALYGQLTQLAIVEPTPATLTRQRSPRLRAWVDRVEDLSGLPVSDADWFAPDEALEATAPLLAEIGRVYLPFLRANAAALAAGRDTVDATIDGAPWTQPVFPYQARCLAALRDALAPLDTRWREMLRGRLDAEAWQVLAGDMSGA
jgi:glutathione S-transferase